MTKIEEYVSNNLQLKNHSFTFILKIESHLVATFVLSRKLRFVARNKAVSLELEELADTNYVGLGKGEDSFGQTLWSSSDSN